MSKMTISESRLQELINESIYEVLQEAQYNEGVGHWLGNKFQTARNKVRNFVNDFKAGQNDAREQNKDYNPYSVYGDREDAVRRMGNGAYPNYRYDLETRRNQKARGEMQNSEQGGQQTQNNNGVQPHPALVQQQQQPNKLQQVRIDREKQAKQALYKSGMVPQGSKDTITGWVRKDGQEPDENQKKLIDNWKRVKLYEAKEKLSNLLEQLNEIGDTDRGQYALGKLCKRQEKRDSKNARETDAYKRASKEINKTPYDYTADKKTFEKNHKKRHNMAMSFDNGYYGRHHKIGLRNEEE